jgi:RNA polymerase sigma factor (sigma-70 family)
MSFDSDNSHKTIDDCFLWEEFRKGSKSAFSILISKYAKSLFEFGYRFCHDKELVMDSLQEMYADLWESRRNLSSLTFVKWYLFKVLKNRILRERTKKRKESLVEDEYDFQLEFNIEDRLIANRQDVELAFKIQKVLNTLSPRKREIIYLRYYEGLSFDEIAEVMNLNKQSVHNLLQKAYNSFRTEWSVLLFFLPIIAKW